VGKRVQQGFSGCNRENEVCTGLQDSGPWPLLNLIYVWSLFDRSVLPAAPHYFLLGMVVRIPSNHKKLSTPSISKSLTVYLRIYI
jgi:hypothetical protein